MAQTFMHGGVNTDVADALRHYSAVLRTGALIKYAKQNILLLTLTQIQYCRWTTDPQHS